MLVIINKFSTYRKKIHGMQSKYHLCISRYREMWMNIYLFLFHKFVKKLIRKRKAPEWWSKRKPTKEPKALLSPTNRRYLSSSRWLVSSSKARSGSGAHGALSRHEKKRSRSELACWRRTKKMRSDSWWLRERDTGSDSCWEEDTQDRVLWKKCVIGNNRVCERHGKLKKNWDKEGN